jgi:hypothetical protein
LGSIKPSPYNPKEPFTKKKYEAVKRFVQKWGFRRDLKVCKNFDTGDGFYCLDGHTAIELHKDLGWEEAKCEIIEEITNRDELVEFITGWAIGKKPSVSEIYKAVGDRIAELYGVDATFFKDKIAEIGQKSKESVEKISENVKQTQYFLTLPPDCVQKLKGFVRSKAFKSNKTEAIVEKIEAMDEKVFLENLLQIVL